MNKKLRKIGRVFVPAVLAIFTLTAVNPPSASAAVSGRFQNGRMVSVSGSILAPVIPFLSANFQLFSPEKQKPARELAIVQGVFLSPRNSPEWPRISNNSESEEVMVRELIVPITAYSSTPDQTDDSPFITARGTHVRDGIVAANFLPFGTKIKIPELFGDKIFVVEDRMNARYWHKIDIWFPDRESALQFGIRASKIQIIES